MAAPRKDEGPSADELLEAIDAKPAEPSPVPDLGPSADTSDSATAGFVTADEVAIDISLEGASVEDLAAAFATSSRTTNRLREALKARL